VDTGIGAALRAAREEQGRSIDDMALALRARVTQLRDLEDERFDAFGGDVYAKGFLKSYAIELGLDPAPLLETYRREVAHDDGEPTALITGMARPKRQRSAAPPRWVAGVVVVVIVLAVIGFVGQLGPGTTPETAGDDALEIEDTPPETPDDTEGDDEGEADPEGEPDADTDDATTEDADADDDEADEDEAEADEPDGIELLLEFEDRSWTRVEVDGTLVLEETVEAGEILPFEGDEEIVVRFGNAGGVRAQLNGEDLGAQGGRGDVVNVVFTRDGAESA
jgi:cytoskeletal protein RodZ